MVRSDFMIPGLICSLPFFDMPANYFVTVYFLFTDGSTKKSRNTCKQAWTNIAAAIGARQEVVVLAV